jgi:aminomethyltransferase
VVNAGTAEKDLDWFTSQRKDVHAVDLEARRDLAIIAVQGPRAQQKLSEARPQLRAALARLSNFNTLETDEGFIARTGYTGEDGFEIMTQAEHARALWRDLAQRGVKPAGLGARDTLRLEAGMNLYGQDMDESVTPLECGLAWTLDLSPSRDFVGRQAIEGARPQKKQIGIVLHDRGVMRAHQRVRTGSGDGEITSGGFSPTMNRSIALARVPVAAAFGLEVEIEMRDKSLRGKLVKPPFVRHGKVLVERI